MGLGNELRLNLLVQGHMARMLSHIQIQDAYFLAFLDFIKCSYLYLVKLICSCYQFSRKLGPGLRLFNQYRDITVFVMNHSFIFSDLKLNQAGTVGSSLSFCSTCIFHKNLSFVYGRNWHVEKKNEMEWKTKHFLVRLLINNVTEGKPLINLSSLKQ